VSATAKRILTAGLAMGVLASAAAGTRVQDRKAAGTIQMEARRLAEAAGQATADALRAYAARLEVRANAAGSQMKLVTIIGEGLADRVTLEDSIKDESWWAPFRSEFSVSAFAIEGDKLDMTIGGDLKDGDLAADALVREVRARGLASGIVMGKGWPYAAAGVSIVIPGKTSPTVLILAKPLDKTIVKELANRSRGAVLLSDGKKSLVSAGAATEVEILEDLVGREGTGGVQDAPQGGQWAARATPVHGLWMWTYASAAAAAHDAASAAATGKAALWAAAGAVALVVLVFGFRKPSTTTSGDALLRETSKRLAETQEALARLSEGSSSPRASAVQPIQPPVTGEGPTQYMKSDPGLSGTTAGPGNVFGRYTLLDRLGEGGMAEVYTAVTFGAEGFRRTFVVKRLRSEMAREPSVVAQFIDEANMASSLVHSNIVPVFDFGKVGDEYFLAQEYILGRDLGRITRRSIERDTKPLPLAPVLFFAHETLKALEYAHARTGEGGKPLGIVHRDVSPNNILVSARGEVKLFDFGIVKAEGRMTKTQHGVVKGNVSFMSPEQARGMDVDRRADLFSLGLVMYYCLAGEVLYRGETTYELLLKAATGPGPDELARISALPAPAAAIVGKALAVERSARYQTAHEFGLAVAPHVAGAAADVARLMQSLFADDFKDEEARFAAAAPPAPPDPGPGGSAKSGPGSGTQHYTTRRS